MNANKKVQATEVKVGDEFLFAGEWLTVTSVTMEELTLVLGTSEFEFVYGLASYVTIR